MQMRCHCMDDASRHFVQCWVAGAEFPVPDPMSPTWRACHCFQSNICLGGMEKESSDTGKLGVLVSMPVAWRLIFFSEGDWGSVCASISIFSLGVCCVPLRLFESKNWPVCPRSEGIL